MKNWHNIGILVTLIVGMVIISGCTNTGSTIPVSQVTVIPTTTISTVSSPATVQTPQVQTSTPVTTMIMTTIPVSQVTLIQNDNPFVTELKFTKNYFTPSINNCPMQEVFPTIAKDPNYGLTQTPPKITALSESEYNVFLRDYTEGKNENQRVIGVARCEGAPITPYWNFVEVRAKIIPRNSRPANYTVSLNVRSQGKIVAQFNTTENLSLEQIIEFINYIPLKTNEMDAFDGVEITFTKLPN